MVKIKYDETIYLVEVTITKTTSDFQANITKIIKNSNNVSTIEFNNQILTNLVITKEVKENISTSGTFNFTIEGSYQEVPMTGTYESKLVGSDQTKTDNLTFNNGKLDINLKHNETITIYGLPYGMKYKVTETNTDGYVVEYQINPDNNDNIYEGSSISGELNENNHLKFINIGGYELPKTGSSQALILIIIGVLLLIIPVIYIGYMFYQKERKVS